MAGLDETPQDKKESCGVRSGESRDRAVVVSGRGRFSIRSSVVILEGSRLKLRGLAYLLVLPVNDWLCRYGALVLAVTTRKSLLAVVGR